MLCLDYSQYLHLAWRAPADRGTKAGQGRRAQVAQRVLVVDDVAEMRIVIRRALRAGGYEVDVAATLTEALGMDPGGYDAVLVDANLGAERGADLIETLRSQDEAVAARCLVITGGAVDMLPERVASLAKPFQLSELLDAVRALQRPPAAAAKSGDPAGPPADLGRPLPAAGPAAGRQPAAGPQLGQLLGVIRRLRAREHRDLADYLHDGPIQELTAASLELQLMRRSAPCSPHVDVLQQQVDGASGALRWLVDGAWSFRSAEAELTEAISARTAWLLAAPVTVDADLRAAESAASDAHLIADVVELMLLATEVAGPTARAHVAVRTDQSLIEVDLARTSGRDDEALGDPAMAQPAVHVLASALGADVHAEFTPQRWRVRLALRKTAA
jgi:CheY-like chemotaxis protein